MLELLKLQVQVAALLVLVGFGGTALLGFTGKNSDIKVNDATLVCAYTARGAYIYMIDTVLTPPTPGAEAGAPMETPMTYGITIRVVTGEITELTSSWRETSAAKGTGSSD